MRRLVVFTLALALGLTSAVTLASCGGEDADLLPGTTAQEITENLDAVKQLANEGECGGAANAADEISAQVESLQGVDPELRQALQQGVARLDEVVTTCEETTIEAPPDTEETSDEEREPPGQEKKAEKEREKEEERAEKEAEKEAKEVEKEEQDAEKEEELPSTPPPSEDGGTGAPGGVSPGEPAEPGVEEDE